MPVRRDVGSQMPWEIFERAAGTYEQWYASRRGQRADQAESALLVHLLAGFPDARTVVEIGCGTGHFTRQMQLRGMSAVGLDRSDAMLRQMRRHAPAIPAILGDAHQLPFRRHAVDLTVFITTLEFLEEPLTALSEAVRITRQGIIVMVLNRWSLGGLSRRGGPQSRRTILGQARDFSRGELERMIRNAAGARWGEARWASTLLPDGLWKAVVRIPVGDVIGVGGQARIRRLRRCLERPCCSWSRVHPASRQAQHVRRAAGGDQAGRVRTGRLRLPPLNRQQRGRSRHHRGEVAGDRERRCCPRDWSDPIGTRYIRGDSSLTIKPATG